MDDAEEGWDWTRTQQQVCPECGLDAARLPVQQLPAALRDEAEVWQRWLDFTPDDEVNHRPADGSWSAIQYACHTRDLLEVFEGRIRRTLVEDDPILGWWDHDSAALEPRYLEATRAAVGVEIVHQADRLAGTLDGISGTAWDRPARRRSHEHFTVAGLARFALHETHHHLGDARRRAAEAR